MSEGISMKLEQLFAASSESNNTMPVGGGVEAQAQKANSSTGMLDPQQRALLMHHNAIDHMMGGRNASPHFTSPHQQMMMNNMMITPPNVAIAHQAHQAHQAHHAHNHQQHLEPNAHVSPYMLYNPALAAINPAIAAAMLMGATGLAPPMGPTRSAFVPPPGLTAGQTGPSPPQIGPVYGGGGPPPLGPQPHPAMMQNATMSANILGYLQQQAAVAQVAAAQQAYQARLMAAASAVPVAPMAPTTAPQSTKTNSVCQQSSASKPTNTMGGINMTGLSPMAQQQLMNMMKSQQQMRISSPLPPLPSPSPSSATREVETSTSVPVMANIAVTNQPTNQPQADQLAQSQVSSPLRSSEYPMMMMNEARKQLATSMPSGAIETSDTNAAAWLPKSAHSSTLCSDTAMTAASTIDTTPGGDKLLCTSSSTINSGLEPVNANEMRRSSLQQQSTNDILNSLFKLAKEQNNKSESYNSAGAQASPPKDIATSILASIEHENEARRRTISSGKSELTCSELDEPINGTASQQAYDEVDVSQLSISLEILDDLASRFVLNMPSEEKDDPIRICFQIEIAFWYYVDFYCETYPNLPRLKLKRFAYIMFTYIPRLRKFLDVFDQVITSWIDYKFSIPTSGAVLLDSSLEYVLLVQGYGSKNWSFPKGKVNHDETLMNCAIREVMEETGYDCTSKIKQDAYLERKIFESACRLFIVTNVEMDFRFHPHARNEIRNIQWFLMSELPMRQPKKNSGANNNLPTTANFDSKFFTVYPFVYAIRKWIEKERKRRRKEAKRERRRTVSSSATGSDAELASTTAATGAAHGNLPLNGVIISCGASDDLNQSASNSPFSMMMEDSRTIESTSFVDVKLDDIFNNTTSGASNSVVPPINEASLRGVEVFNADREPDAEAREAASHQHAHLSGSAQDWPSTWQALVNEYNRRNSIHTPIGYDLMAAPRRTTPSSCSSPFAYSQPQQHQQKTPTAPNIALDKSPGSSLGSFLSCKELRTCDDKLNFLFRAAESKQQQQEVNPSRQLKGNNSSANSMFSALAMGSKSSPFGAIGSKQKNNNVAFANQSNGEASGQQEAIGAGMMLRGRGSPSSNVSTTFNIFNFATLTGNSSLPNQQQRQVPCNPTETSVAQAQQKSANQTNESSIPHNGEGIISSHEEEEEEEEAIESTSPSASSEDTASCTERAETKMNGTNQSYNGLDVKNVPVIEDKIFKLLERLKLSLSN